MQILFLRVAASCFVEGISLGAWPACWWRVNGNGWVKVDHPAPRPTCCLSNTLIRFRCEWTWHCDIKGFHSLDVCSSPYCINMPLMFHSDTRLFGVQWLWQIHAHNDMTLNGIHFWFGLISSRNTQIVEHIVPIFTWKHPQTTVNTTGAISLSK